MRANSDGTYLRNIDHVHSEGQVLVHLLWQLLEEAQVVRDLLEQLLVPWAPLHRPALKKALHLEGLDDL